MSTQMTRVDTLIIGSGIAGLTAALEAAKLGTVALVTKAALHESNTRYAQGGIAVVTGDDDTVELHVQDTLAAGAGLNDEAAVRVLCAEGPQRITDLLAFGVAFDRHEGELSRGLEAAHQRHRVLHAGGDATGWHVETALVNAVRAAGVTIYEHATLADLTVSCGRVKGASFVNVDGSRLSITASATMLATGGAGQLYRHTTNPGVATGDGVAAAFRAGAVLADLEFMQFHPTAAALPRSFLLSEAVRGEGAVLRDANGRRFMLDVDARAELAPRDVVARAIAFTMADQDGQPVFLDATALGADFLAQRFPTIDHMVRDAGIDWSKEPVPITPAAHYWMGGVRTDLFGRTSLPGLYAVGEVANTGVHGANRLASNSLLEGLVFGHRAIASLGQEWPADVPMATPVLMDDLFVLPREELQALMWDNVGLVREAHGLRITQKSLTAPVPQVDELDDPDAIEDRNLATVARLTAGSALAREESRGAHYRADHVATETTWQRHSLVVRAR